MAYTSVPVKLPILYIRKMDKHINKKPQEFKNRPDFLKFLINLYDHTDKYGGNGKKAMNGGEKEDGHKKDTRPEGEDGGDGKSSHTHT